jgi:hypothetical protein
MTVSALMESLNQLNIGLSVGENGLEVTAPRGTLTDELRAAIREHKAALVTFLQNGKEGMATAPIK